jgi:hypothetical protein
VEKLAGKYELVWEDDNKIDPMNVGYEDVK